MRRLLVTAVVVLAAGALAVVGTGAGGEGGREYTVELDNAFGLIEGGDLKIAGVRAGKITKLRVDRGTRRALVDFQVDATGFGSLRSDVECESKPQSLIGEYFIDCRPGTADRELPPGSTIPVEQTASTVPADLVNNILRRPYRERLRLLIGELGAGVAGNARNLNAALRRAVPALRETDQVLATLAEQNQVLAELVTNADTVITDLAENRDDVGRWVLEARDTAAASAERQRDIAAGFRRLPGFLRELRPTMSELGEVADEQRPALRNLAASAGELERLFDNLRPFSRVSTPAFDALGEASKVGRRAVRAAAPTVEELQRFSGPTPELANNLTMVLEHLNDREHAIEDDPRSPGGEGYTGLEALLQYVYDIAVSTNVYDQTKHMLKVAVFESPCAGYADAKTGRELGEQCSSDLGPTQPGVTSPDPTLKPGETHDGDDSVTLPREETDSNRSRRTARKRQAGRRRAARSPQRADRRESERPSRRELDLGDLLPGGSRLPKAPVVPLPGTDGLPRLDRLAPGTRPAPRTRDRGSDAALLGYLLGP